MRHLTLVVATVMALSAPAPGTAQEEADSGTEWELGVLFGYHHVAAGSESAWAFTVPGVPLYAGLFPGDRFSVGTEVTFIYASADVDDTYSANIGGYGIVFLEGTAGPYGLVKAGVDFGSDSESEVSVAGGLGALTRISPGFALRMEARFRRWRSTVSHPGSSAPRQFSVLIGIGSRIGGASW